MRIKSPNENWVIEFSSKYKGIFIFMDNIEVKWQWHFASQGSMITVFFPLARVSMKMERDLCGQRLDFK